VASGGVVFHGPPDLYCHRGVEALTSTSPMAIFLRVQFATPVSHVTKGYIFNTLNKVGVNFQRTKKSYALFWFSEPFA